MSNTKFIYCFLLATIIFLTTKADIPAEWSEKIARGQMLYGSVEPDASLMASVGNGYLASVIGSDTIYVAGVYSGLNVKDPSQRARIPATNSFIIQNANLSGAALDLQEAIYYRRLELNGYKTVVEQRWYAARADKSLFIHEIFVDNSQEQQDVQLAVLVNRGGDSQEISFVAQEPWRNDTSFTRILGTTNVAEYPMAQRLTIAVVYSNFPESLQVAAGQQQLFSHVTVIKTSMDASDPLSDATIEYEKALQSLSEIKQSHTQEWARLWESRIDFSGNLELAQVVNSTLYYLLSSARQDVPWSLSPGGLASNAYFGHVFWDTETWMYPGLLLLHPDIARDNLLQYRINHQDGAMLKASSYNPPYDGTMFPWESAFTGQETCLEMFKTGEYEHHISGDVAFAMRQYWDLTQDIDWLVNKGYPVIRGIAKFWASRVVFENGVYVINGVVPPDESSFGNNSAYTNAVAKIAMDFAIKAAGIVGDTVPELWVDISSKMKIPFDEVNQIHPEYDGYDGHIIRQADVTLLGFPLGYPMSKQIRQNDLDYYTPRVEADGPAMTFSMEVISRLELGQYNLAVQAFPRAYANYKAPFGVWTETASGGAVNFITGAGGFLQSILFGWAGIRILDSELSVNPTLPPSTEAMTVRGLHFRDSSLQIHFNSTHVVLQALHANGALSVLLPSGELTLAANSSLIFSVQYFSIK